jgi:hypothetical protein
MRNRPSKPSRSNSSLSSAALQVRRPWSNLLLKLSAFFWAKVLTSTGKPSGKNFGPYLLSIRLFRTLMVSDNFISRILNFDSETVRPETIRALEKYLSNPDFEFEKINRASVACGPMVKVTYS